MGRAGAGAVGQGSPAMTAEATAEPRTITTMRADQLQPGDHVLLIDNSGGDCLVLDVKPHPEPDKRVTLLLSYWRIALGGDAYVQDAITLALWKYSRVEVLSDVSGRGHLVTPMTSAMASESME